jgi:plastocyanin
MKKRLITIVFLISIAVISNNCTKSSNNTTVTGGTGGPPANEVYIQGMAFNPVSITVTAGTTIKWTNKDAVTHTVTSSTNLFNSGNMTNGATFSYTFATAGTYSYYCAIHTYMVAAVTVN